MHVRRCLTGALVALALVTTAQRAAAEETWQITSGRTAIHLYDYLLEDLGLEVINLNETAGDPTPAEAHMEPPFITFALSDDTDFQFRSEGGQFALQRGVNGTLQHQGGFQIHHRASGYTADFLEFVIDHRDGVDGPGNIHVVRDWLFMRSDVGGEELVELMDSEPIFDRGEQTLNVYNLTLFITEGLAEAIARPELVGQPIGTMALIADARFVSGTYVPNDTPDQTVGSFLDVELGQLYDVNSVGHSGTYPNGICAIGMSTTSCNPGDVNVPWEAPMDENHPLIAQQFYRLNSDGLLEQLGIAWLKHGFYALSNDECGIGCSHNSGGTYLAIGCSDTYGVGNNTDRYWLGPREEVNGYTAEWECTGSFFAGFQNDCTRRESGNGWGPTAHRIEVADGDLADPGARFFFEGYYAVIGDQDLSNNFAHRETDASWTGSSWDLDEFGPNSGIQEPVILSWGDRQSLVNGVGDGSYFVAVRSVHLGSGFYRYEYNVLNRDSERQLDSFSVPVGNANISSITFRDWDLDAATDWTGVAAGGNVTWTAPEDYATNPDYSPMIWGSMHTMTFIADSPPVESEATLSFFKPGTGDEITAATDAPAAVVAVGDPAVSPIVVRLVGARPNPLRSGSTSIAFELAERGQIHIDVYDAGGRIVRGLAGRTMSVGRHSVEWDGRNDRGARVAGGVYYARLLMNGSVVGSRSIVVIE